MAKQHANRSNEPLSQANNKKQTMNFQAIPVVTVTFISIAFRDVTPEKVVERYQQFEETCCLTGTNSKHL
jgi:hypothetical protein